MPVGKPFRVKSDGSEKINALTVEMSLADLEDKVLSLLV